MVELLLVLALLLAIRVVGGIFVGAGRRGAQMRTLAGGEVEDRRPAQIETIPALQDDQVAEGVLAVPAGAYTSGGTPYWPGGWQGQTVDLDRTDPKGFPPVPPAPQAASSAGGGETATERTLPFVDGTGEGPQAIDRSAPGEVAASAEPAQKPPTSLRKDDRQEDEGSADWLFRRFQDGPREDESGSVSLTPAEVLAYITIVQASCAEYGVAPLYSEDDIESMARMYEVSADDIRAAWLPASVFAQRQMLDVTQLDASDTPAQRAVAMMAAMGAEVAERFERDVD